MSRKFLITIILILFLLPFVSWYYLRSGLAWRKDAQEKMKGSQPFPVLTYTDLSGRTFSSEQLKSHVSIISYYSCSGDHQVAEVLEDIYHQFAQTEKAYFILLDTCKNGQSTVEMQSRKNWMVIPCADSLPYCQAIEMDWPPLKPFALVDRHGIIRSYYSIDSPGEKKTLVEHMALLLPRERQEKVELKRGDKK